MATTAQLSVSKAVLHALPRRSGEPLRVSAQLAVRVTIAWPVPETTERPARSRGAVASGGQPCISLTAIALLNQWQVSPLILTHI